MEVKTSFVTVYCYNSVTFAPFPFDQFLISIIHKKSPHYRKKMLQDFQTVLRDLEVIDHKLSKVERNGSDMDGSAIVYDVAHLRTILLGTINRLDTLVHDGRIYDLDAVERAL